MFWLDRRGFLRTSMATAMAAAAAEMSGGLFADDAPKPARKGSAADRIRVACIGVRGQGRGHVGAYSAGSKNGLNTEVAIICDADEGVIGGPMEAAEKNQGYKPKYIQDIRRVLEDKSIDAVSIATPNHWHALAAIWALQAGKHVYVEKPVSHNVREGRIMVATARKHGLICQTGTQSRSQKGMRESIAYIHAGKIGKVRLGYGTCYKRRGSIGKVTGPQPVPKTVDYDLWCGPAPKKPLMRKNLHYDWHWVWDTGNGDLGNQGIHEMDKARWGLGKQSLPTSVISIGGRFGYDDDGETANTQLCIFDYGDAELIFEVRGLPTISPYPAGAGNGKRGDNFVGNIWFGDKGIVVCPSYSSGMVLDPEGKTVVEKFSGGGDHFGNFIKAVRSKKHSDLNADIEEGHLSSALCHLGNISYRLGSVGPLDKAVSALGDDKDASEAMKRMAEHLESNKAMDAARLMIGRKLAIDPKAETFKNDKEADNLLFREYRKGFEVPATV
jgi:predicted dehydrogenase